MNKANALHIERDGKKFYFCSDKCEQKFLYAFPGQSRRKSLDAAVDKKTATAKNFFTFKT